MSRPIVWMKEEKAVDLQRINNLTSEAISELALYLDHYMPKSGGFSKSSLMGPVGKMLSAIVSDRIIDRDAIIGYVVNIHRNTAKTPYLSPEAMQHLQGGLNKLLELRKIVPKRIWVKTLREVDYGVFKRKYQYIIERALEKKEIEKEGE